MAVSSDFNGDGISDILWGHNGDRRIVVWQVDDFKIVQGGTIGMIGSVWDIEGIGNFNPDLRADIVWKNEGAGPNGGTITTWLMNGVAAPTGAPIGKIGPAWEIQGAGDFDGDGNSDIVFKRDDSFVQASIWLMNGTTPIASHAMPRLGLAWDLEAFGDVNGDGSDDFLWRHDDGRLAIWEQSAGKVTATRTFAPIGNDWDIEGTGDFNGDGKQDLVWEHEDERVVIWLMDGVNVAAASQLGTPPGAGHWDFKKTGDFNGDGKDDILWQNDDDGRLLAWEMDGTTIVSAEAMGRLGDEWTLIG